MPFYKKLFHKIKKEVLPSEWKPETRKEAAELAEAAMMVMPVLKVAKVGKVAITGKVFGKAMAKSIAETKSLQRITGQVVEKVGPAIREIIKKEARKVLPREFGLGEAWREVKFPKPTEVQIKAAKEAQRRFDIIFTRGKETAAQVEKGLKKYFKGKW